jgi:hypothetical protein
MLIAEGGLGPDGMLVAPRFFEAFLGHAEQVAVALRVCARGGTDSVLPAAGNARCGTAGR